MNGKSFLSGVRDGIPISLGYFAVSFSMGITCRSLGLSAVQSFFLSFLNHASAGQYAGLTVIAADAGFFEMALMMVVINARYMLMSCALSQKISPETPFFWRFIIGYQVTDEIFGIAVAQPGFLNPWYYLGAMLITMPGWESGTVIGNLVGSILPPRLSSAFCVALFGMFIAIIIPPARKDKVVFGCVALGFLFSYLCGILPGISALSDGMRTIFLTVLISGIAAALFPRKEEAEA